MKGQFYLFAIFASVALATSFAANATSGNGISGGGTIIYPPNVVNANNATIIAANNMVIQKVGTSYFQSYIRLTSAQTYSYNNGTNISHVAYSYSIPYLNGSTTGGYVRYGGLVGMLGISVQLSGNTATYSGPAGPYYLKINESQAVAIAHSNGFDNITGIYVSSAYASAALAGSGGYKLDWAVVDGSYVSTGNCSQGCRVHPGLYINTSTGAIDGEFSVNPAIEAPSGPTYAVLGDYSIFNLTQQPSSSSQSASAAFFQAIGIRIALIGIALLIVMFMVSRRKPAKRSQH